MTTATHSTHPATSGRATVLEVVAFVLAILLPLVGMIVGSVAGIRARAAGGSARVAHGAMFLGGVLMVGELIFLAGWGLPQLLN